MDKNFWDSEAPALRKLIIFCALALSLFSCASRSPYSGFSAQTNYWNNQKEVLLQEKEPLENAWDQWNKREAAVLPQLSEDELIAYKELWDAQHNDDLIGFNIAYKKINRLLLTEPSLRTSINGLIDDRLALLRRTDSYNEKAEKYEKGKAAYIQFQNSIMQAYGQVQQEARERQQQYQQQQQQYQEQQYQRQYLDELNRIGTAIQNLQNR